MPEIRQPTASVATTTSSITVLVDGLTYPANTYDEITIFCVNSSGTIIDQVSANDVSGGSGWRTTNVTFYGLSSGTTYRFYAQVRYLSTSARVRVPDSGYLSVTTLPEAKPRPSNFYWSYSKSSGSSFNLYAFEWNNLFSRINEFRDYKNLGSYSYSSAQSGSIFYAHMFNQAVYAISAMSPSISPPSTVSSGDTIYAYQMNGLVNSLNSIN